MIKKKLKNYFPMLREREEILDEIMKKSVCKRIYQKWTAEQQKHFILFQQIDCCHVSQFSHHVASPSSSCIL